MEDQPRYEFRVFDENLLHVKERLERVARFTAAASTRETYLVSTATDRCSAKIRAGLMDIKILIREEQRLEQWKPVLKARFPLERSVLVEQFYPLLALVPSPLPRSRYREDEFLSEIIWPDHRIAAVDVSKERREYEMLLCRAEFAEVAINRIIRNTVAAESTDPESLVQVTKTLSIRGFGNTSYIREIKHVLGMPPA